ncbi:MAG: hypothetical protein IIT50_02310 [Bacteroidales bacterium]|nr:hypothetical protein [Bacteroidales bacterium]
MRRVQRNGGSGRQEGQEPGAGVRPEYDGLLIDPCLPDSIDGFRLTRLFRGTRYDITVKRGERKGLVADGKAFPGNLIPLTSSPSCLVELTI